MMAHVLTNEELLEQFDLEDYMYGIQRNAFFAGFRAGYAYAGKKEGEEGQADA